MYNSRTPAILALENGITFKGYAFGDCDAEAKGEIVFNTAMSGYQEILTDPSYKGQVMTFTYPHIGNYGINLEDNESGLFQAEGVIVRESSKIQSNWRSIKSLSDWMLEHNKIGVEEIDTRALVRVLRSSGVMRGIISAQDLDCDRLVARAKQIPSMEGLDLTSVVTTRETYLWENDNASIDYGANPIDEKRFKVAALDFGIKRNILRRLSAWGCDVTVYPASTSAEIILAENPDGIFLSNGPGDPAAAVYAIETVKKLIHAKPIFGICLGHQLLGLALGAKTYKLKFGHRGANHPVRYEPSGAVEISSQNHGFAVDATTLPNELEPTHINLNDNTLSGMRHRELPIFSVQYHPEASPGPHDSDYLFRQFVEMMAKNN